MGAGTLVFPNANTYTGKTFVANGVLNVRNAAQSPDHAERTAQAADVQRALLAVPSEFRAALVMHEIQDLPVEEIATILGIPTGTVKSRLHRGRVALARALQPGQPLPSGPEPRPATTPSNPPTP